MLLTFRQRESDAILSSVC